MSRMIYDCTDKDLLYRTSNHTALGMDGVFLYLNDKQIQNITQKC